MRQILEKKFISYFKKPRIFTVTLTGSILFLNGCVGGSNDITNIDNSFQSGDTWKGLVYRTITSPTTGKIWLDRNLGASQVCVDYNDTACYGNYYQWGREADGHESNISATTTSLATDLNTIGNSSFITTNSSPFDWTALDSDGALRSAKWSKTDGSSVCPVGYRVPTSAEFSAEHIVDRNDAFTTLKLPSAGFRLRTDGSFLNYNTEGSVWSNVLSSNTFIFTNSGSYTTAYDKANGMPIRCIKN